MKQVVQINGERVATAQSMMNAVNDAVNALLNMPLAEDAEDTSFQDKQLTAALKHYDDERQHFGHLVGHGLPAAQAELLAQIDQSGTGSRTAVESVVRALKSDAKLGLAAFQSMDPRPGQVMWLKSLGQLVVQERDAQAREYEEAHAFARRSSYLLATAVLVATVLGILCAQLIVRGVTKPLFDAIGHAGRIAGGDLTQPIRHTRRDEAGQLLDALAQMQIKLSDTVGAIRASSCGLAETTSDIAAGSSALSLRTERNSSRLQQTAAAIEQLTQAVKNSSEAAHQAMGMAEGASAVANRGGEVVGRVVTTMSDINASSKKIAEIISVIDGIAFQTNILALNAAVESARAGEQGRGFAVVANEVRSLAQRSARAAHEIKDLIQASVDKVDVGARLVEEAGATMGDIVASVQHVRDVIGGISTAASDQSRGIVEVNQAVIDLDGATQQNAALVQQSSAAVLRLEQQASRLDELVGVFRLA